MPRGNVKTLKPVRTTEEAQERGHNGGVNSGASRRAKRDCKGTIRLMLENPCPENIKKQMAVLGYAEEDATNMLAMVISLLKKAMSGDVNAFKTLMDYAGYAPSQDLIDKERLARIDAIQNGGKAGAVISGEGEGSGGDVVIYLPKLDELPDENEEPVTNAEEQQPPQ